MIASDETEPDVDSFRRLASGARAIDETVPASAVRQALMIRAVEQKLLTLFAQGAMNGTIHTCVGQEFAAVAVAGQLTAEDWVTSNHRCHGHFIAKTGMWAGLVDELMGLKSGVCMGIGSSQHLFAPGFLSNGPQAALLPVGTGIALHQRRNGGGGICGSFLGEGTFGEGVLYEAFNLAALWQLPQLFICENNLYSQSTAQALAVAGTIQGRAQAFAIRYFEGDTWNVKTLMSVARAAIDHVRSESKPALLCIRTYRLNAHSKGDDDRAAEEIAFFAAHDPLTVLLSRSSSWRAVQAEIASEIDAHVISRARIRLSASEYVFDQLPRDFRSGRAAVRNEKIRMVQALNRAYRDIVADGAFLIGEDLLDPYGGAFKVTRGLSSEFPERVLGSPISEAAITGIGIGLSLMGTPTYVEIMFGDFMTNTFDQLINNASKMFHMYGMRISVPVRVRTPMGGKRGYGPTHSQSLEKHLVGIDNVAVIALSSLAEPAETLAAINGLSCPVIIVESKVDYGRFLWQACAGYEIAREGGPFGALVISPTRHAPTASVIAYGETARDIADHLEELFIETDTVIELVVPLSLHPLHTFPIFESVRRTRRVFVMEDGSTAYGIGAEVVARIAEHDQGVCCRRIGAEPVPIPSILELEKALLPSARKLMAALMQDTDTGQ